MKIMDMLNDKTSAALGGVAAGVPGLLASGCATRPCTACFACAASLAALGGIWLKGRLKGAGEHRGSPLQKSQEAEVV